jgi:predicted DsbA family dithiol-disulfide isomerase
VSDILITEFTDPGCPWAYSAEPFRLKLRWLYGDALEWEYRMVVLAESTQEYLDKGLTPELLEKGMQTIARAHGMPIDTGLRERVAGTVSACRAVVATRLNAPDYEEGILRALRIRCMSGELLDESSTIRAAAVDVCLDPGDVERWCDDRAVEAAMREDMVAARHPTPEALALDDRLADWDGGRRYTCPSYEIVRTSDGARISVPGFQPFPAYDVALANLIPGAERRARPESVSEVLEWADMPLATREIEVICEIDRETARQELGRVADETHVGSDGFWSLAG